MLPLPRPWRGPGDATLTRAGTRGRCPATPTPAAPGPPPSQHPSTTSPPPPAPSLLIQDTWLSLVIVVSLLLTIVHVSVILSQVREETRQETAVWPLLPCLPPPLLQCQRWQHVTCTPAPDQCSQWVTRTSAAEPAWTRCQWWTSWMISNAPTMVLTPGDKILSPDLSRPWLYHVPGLHVSGITSWSLCLWMSFKIINAGELMLMVLNLKLKIILMLWCQEQVEKAMFKIVQHLPTLRDRTWSTRLGRGSGSGRKRRRRSWRQRTGPRRHWRPYHWSWGPSSPAGLPIISWQSSPPSVPPVSIFTSTCSHTSSAMLTGKNIIILKGIDFLHCSPINPFCYAASNPQFKNAFRRIIKGDLSFKWLFIDF